MAQKNYALVGVAGYIAPRHLKAIADTGGNLIVAYDKFDSVGRLDSFFPQASFFTEQGLFERHISKLRNRGINIDFLTVCTPNYTHDSFIRYGLEHNMDVICEKPVVLNPWNLEELKQLEQQSGRKAYTILQLRLHDSIAELKKRIETGPKDKVYDVDMTYITSRGKWYYASWKGDETKSGGLATNIGVHLYDMLQWVFGTAKKSVVHIKTHDRVAGYLELERARVRYFLSINEQTLPANAVQGEKKTFRSITIDGEELEFSQGFTELHALSYKKILEGEGFRIGCAAESLKMIYDIRHAEPVGLKGDYHPLAKLPIAEHPFGWINR